MVGTRRSIRHLSVAILGATIAAAGGVAGQTTDPTGTASFTILLRGARIGAEQVSLSRTGNGWLVSATGHLQPPFDLTTTKFEAAYGADWQPQQLVVEGLLHGQPLRLATTFGLTTATNDLTQGLQHASSTQQISPRAVVLPANTFAAYEALAQRLATATVGTRIPLYIVPDTEVATTVDSIAPARLSLPEGTADLRVFGLTVANPAGAVPLQLWIDGRNRLARLTLPTSSLTVIRDDLSSVMAREEHARNPADQDAFIPANGFNLAATITPAATTIKPAPAAPASAPAIPAATGSGASPAAGPTTPGAPPPRAPAAVLVSAAGPMDRDYTIYGVPVFAELAGALSDAGIFAVRYDSRGTGQSGGRNENSGVSEYAEDVSAVINALRKRRDVDPDRIVVVGYSETAPVALVAADRDKHVKAVALLSAGGTPGRDLTLEQQRLLLSKLPMPAADKAAKVALESRIIEATISGRWEGLPADTRRQADTAWFRSWLAFDPAAVIPKLNQPILILQGALDAEVPASHADRLEQLARSRRKAAATDTTKVVIPATNHLLVHSQSDTLDDSLASSPHPIAPEAASALTTWIKQAVASR
jgi:pimeloyl-ACP methyl ester carboxylesterase